MPAALGVVQSNEAIATSILQCVIAAMVVLMYGNGVVTVVLKKERVGGRGWSGHRLGQRKTTYRLQGILHPAAALRGRCGPIKTHSTIKSPIDYHSVSYLDTQPCGNQDEFKSRTLLQ